MSNPKQREFFERAADTWDGDIIHDPGRIGRIMGIIGMGPDMDVLDVGTGTGVMIPYYAEAMGETGRVVAVDYSQNMVERAMEKFPEDEWPNVSFVVSDVNDLPMRGEFDVIVCYSCFPHFVDQQATIDHLFKGLRPEGHLVVAHSSPRDEINRVHLEAGEEVHEDLLPTMGSMVNMFEDAGLIVTETVDDDVFVIIGRR